MFRRSRGVASWKITAAIGALTLLVCLVGVLRVRSFEKKGGRRLYDSLGNEVLGKPGPLTRADLALEAVARAFKKAQDPARIWGFGMGEKAPRKPDRGAVEKALKVHGPFRRAVIAEVVPGLEQSGADCLLNGTHWYRIHRSMANRLAEDVLSLLYLGRTREALETLEAGDRMGRILGRGILGFPVLMAKMIEIAVRAQYAHAVALALKHGYVSRDDLNRLDLTLKALLAKEIDLTPSMEAAFGFIEKIIPVAEARLGLWRPFARMRWGNGKTDLARCRRLWREKQSMPPIPELKQMHFAVRLGLPNVTAALRRYRARKSMRHGVRAAVEIERCRYRTGSYPTEAPSSVLDPFTGEPFKLIIREGKAILYGVGPNKKDDGGKNEYGKPLDDVLVWE